MPTVGTCVGWWRGTASQAAGSAPSVLQSVHAVHARSQSMVGPKKSDLPPVLFCRTPVPRKVTLVSMGKGGGNVHPHGAGAAGTASGDGALRRPRSSPDGAASNLMRRVFHPTGTVGLGLVGTEASGGGGGGGRDDISRDGADTGSQPNSRVASSDSLIGSNGERSQDVPGTAAASSRNFPQHRGRKRSRRSFDGHDDDDDNDVAPDVPSVAPAEDSEAFGYVMLDDCSVLIGNTDDDISDCGPVLTGQWTDVTVLHPQEKEDEGMVVEEEGRVSAQHPSICRRRDLVLHRNVGGEDDNVSPSCGWLMMDSSSIVRFDGTTLDAKCVPQSSPSAKNTDDGDDENRSDAALLMGLILNCQDLGLVKITKCSIALHGRDGPKEQQDRNSSDGGAPNQNHAVQYRASIVTTLSVDLIANRSFAASSTSNAKPPAKKRARRSSSSSISSRSPLKGRNRGEIPSSMQLLLSMMRCDFSRMNAHMETQLELKRSLSVDDESAVAERRSIFPKTLCLDELYQRIRGASSCATDGDGLDASRKKLIMVDVGDRIYSPFSDPALLPNEVIVVHISVFLRAESLHNLRCASPRLNKLLRAVVPGLKLRLFKHQINSLDWMRKREIKGLNEADTLHDHGTGLDLAGGEDALVGGDFHRAASGGASILLCRGNGNVSLDSESNTVRINGRNGAVIDSNSLSAVGRLKKFARGGLLCDDPGLGKTITVLSVVLCSFGLSTTKKDSNASKNGSNSFSTCGDEEIFRSYWREGLTSFGRTPELLRLVNDLRRFDSESVYFEFPIDPEADGASDYFDIVKQPLCMADILQKINIHGYGDDFERLCSDVELVFRNAMLYNPPDHHVHKAAKRLSDKFKELVATFKNIQTKNAKKAYGSISSKPDSSVAAILAERANDELIDSLCPSSGNLLIVPNTLLKHWENQISMHIDFRYLTKKIPLVFRLRKKGKASHTKEEVMRLCNTEKTHFPLLLIDEGTHSPLPPPSFLAMFHVVLTTNQRIQSEWKFGSVEEELKISKGGRQASYRAFYDDIITDTPPPSPLLKVNWLRLVVDEGHVMGRGTNSNTIQFASWITAQRRWAMTGTPTQQTANQSGLRNILGLVKFLKHDFFAARLGGDQVWTDLIARSWNEGNLSSFFRLRMLLSLLMVRHTKADIQEVPAPKYLKSYTRMSPEELKSYNTLVSAAQMNIVTTSMEGKTSGWQDSLLNPRQTKHARKALDNIRLACCGGAHVLPRLEDRLWVETIQYLRMLHNLDDVKVAVVDNYLKRATTGELSSCMSCGLQLQTLFVVPCGCLICTECIDSETSICPNCEQPFDVDDFQRLQPGLIYEWSLSLKEEALKRESEEALRRQLDEVHSFAQSGSAGNNNAGSGVVPPHLAQVVNGRGDDPAPVAGEGNGEPIDLVNGNGDGNGSGAANGEVSPSRAARHRRMKNHTCTFSRSVADGKCLKCREEHFDCNFLLGGNRCSLCYKRAEGCPAGASKALLVTNKLLSLREKEIAGNRVFQRPLKAIIFSQFRLSLDYVGDRLIRRFGGACIAEYWGSTRSKELEKFATSPSCFCMLLGKEGSHGLDLSFVTNIILLDEMYDRSLQEQVVARAYRMGATGRVEVEQLIANDSIEELMESLTEGGQLPVQGDRKEASGGTKEKNDAAGTSTNTTQSSRQAKTSHAKMHYLLKNVRLARGVDPNQRDADSEDDGDKKLPAKSESSSRPQPRVRFGEPTVHSIE